MIRAQVIALLLATAGASGAEPERLIRGGEVEPRVVLREMPLSEALTLVSRHTGLVLRPLVVDEFHDAGLDLEVMVGPLELPRDRMMAVEALLSATPADDFDRPTWQMAGDGAVLIGPRSRLDAFVSLRAYDVQDLLAVLPDYVDVPEMDIDAALSRTGGAVFSGNDENVPIREGELEMEPDELMDLICAMVEPDCWRENGGEAASIMLYQGRLMVRAPGYVHRALGGRE